MPTSLTPQQAGELNKSIIAYLSANGLPETLAAFQKESDLPDDRFDATAAKQYENLLEKKWTSNSTLMKKVATPCSIWADLLLALESRNEALQNELNSTRASFLNRNADVNNWLPQHPIRSLESHRDSINCIAFHPKYSLIASGSSDLTIRIWDWEDGTLERTLKGHTMAVCDVDYGDTSSGVLLASCSSDFTIKLWDTTDDYKNVKTLRGHDHIVSAVRFIPSGNLLASASRDMKVILWNVVNGYRVKTIEGHTGWVRDISPSFDGQFLLSTGDDMTVRLWDISASQPICKFTATGHENRILCCAVAPAASFRYLASFFESKRSTRAAGITAEIMATGSRDKTIKLWDSRGRCIMNLTGHASWVRAIAFHPGGSIFFGIR
ncbi:hypothetical protein N7517_008945 [Penicillium concentricum]|uniref:Mitochondrial division protein 1 n=1 Tax=Penicillium concentricum TaxID=293559 RepID=A0A9W9RVJ5_9EURO|nr:uncharacterized protein N7517_008945 [Penicillium concentricum]KAJ5366059.1 hypothetical protein N7517_008945 [Penicillium concentricum]